MRNYITFEKADLSSTITTLGFNLHKISESIIYFQQYARLKGVEHDAVIEIAIRNINKSIEILKHEFNLPIENNSCLESISGKKIEEVVNRATKDHYNPYIPTIPKLQELVRSFLEIAEKEGKDVNWEELKSQCKRML